MKIPFSVVGLLLLIGCKTVPAEDSTQPVTPIPADQMVQLQDVRLHYLDWGGTGDLVLLVPGVTATAHVWNAVAPRLVDRYRVIAVTRREHGASESTGRPFDLDDLADDLGQVIRHFSEGPAIVIGHSYAGLEMPRLYQRHPDQVRALVFVDALFGRPWNGSGPPRAPGFGPLPTSPSSIGEAVSWFREMFPGVTPELATHYVESQYLTDQSGQLQLRIPVPGEMLTRFLALKESWAPTDYEGIDVPVLAIRAAQAGYFASNLEARGFATDSIDLAVRWAREVDDVQKGGTTEALLQAVPGARSVVLDSTSHTLPLDRPEVVSRLILEFLASEVSR